MSIGVILILAVTAWLIGPFALQLAGGAAIALAAIVLTIEPGDRTIAGVSLAAIGTLMLCAGSFWRVHRFEGTCTLAGGWVRERIARAILRGNPHARAQRWLAIRIAWRLPRWRLDELFREADESARSEKQSYGANGNGEQAMDEHSSASDDDFLSLSMWFDAIYPPQPLRSRYGRYSAEPWEKEAPEGSVREKMNRTLEEIRRRLEPVMRNLFALDGSIPDWHQELEGRRVARLGCAGRLPSQGEKLGDCRVLFSTIADDWTMIGAYFVRDPSPAARELLAILDRYDHDGPGEDDPAKATQAFQEILGALRPQARELLRDVFSRAAAIDMDRLQGYARRHRETSGTY